MIRVTSRRCIAITNRGHVWLFVFDPESRAELLREAGRMASDTDNPWTWYDAAKLSQIVREQT